VPCFYRTSVLARPVKRTPGAGRIRPDLLGSASSALNRRTTGPLSLHKTTISLFGRCNRRFFSSTTHTPMQDAILRCRPEKPNTLCPKPLGWAKIRGTLIQCDEKTKKKTVSTSAPGKNSWDSSNPFVARARTESSPIPPKKTDTLNPVTLSSPWNQAPSSTRTPNRRGMVHCFPYGDPQGSRPDRV